MTRILVTGGAGFIGSHVVDKLVNCGDSVVVLDDLSGGFEKNVNPSAEFVRGSVVDDKLVRTLFAEHKFDYVFHIAAYAAEGLSHFIRRFNYANNLLGSINLINESVKHRSKHFVFTSSIAVYGSNQLPMTEDTVPMPEDPYGIAKLAVEQDLRAANEMFGLEYTVFRPHNVYGERQNIGDKYRNVLGIFMNQIMQGRPITIFGDGSQTRAFSHIEDVAPVIAMSASSPSAKNEVFNIGADRPYSVNDLAKIVCGAMGVPNHPIRHEPARNEVAHAYASHDKVMDLLGYRDTIGLEEGVRRMAEWAKKEGVQKSADFKNIEILEGLPPSWIPSSPIT